MTKVHGLLVSVVWFLSASVLAYDIQLDGKTFFAYIDRSLALSWFTGASAKSTGDTVPAELRFFSNSDFEYWADGQTFSGHFDQNLMPHNVALFFDANKGTLPEGVFIPLEIASNGSELQTPLFSFSDKPQAQDGVRIIATFTAELDATTATHWWNSYFWVRADTTCWTKIELLEGNRFRYKVAGKLLATGTYSTKPRDEKKRSLSFVFDDPQGRTLIATYFIGEPSLLFNHAVRFTPLEAFAL